MRWREHFIMKLLEFLFYSLPDFAGIFLAATGLALIFVPELQQKLEKRKRVRWVLAAIISFIGIGGVISNSIQKSADKDAAKAERSALNNQIKSLISL
jgi:hypothetical protein